MIIFLIYLFGAIFFAFSLVALNYQFKWATKDDISDPDDIMPIVVVAIVIWPLSLIALTCVGIIYAIYKFGIPDGPSNKR